MLKAVEVQGDIHSGVRIEATNGKGNHMPSCVSQVGIALLLFQRPR